MTTAMTDGAVVSRGPEQDRSPAWVAPALSWLVRGGAFVFSGVETWGPALVDGPVARAVTVAAYLISGLTLVGLAWVDFRAVPGVTGAAPVPLMSGVVAATAGFACTFPHAGPMVAVALTTVLQAGSELAPSASWAVVSGGVLAMEAGALITGTGCQAVLGYPLLTLVALLTGHNRRAHRVRAEQTAAVLAQVERLSAERCRVAVLGERTRIAREIHDVLAHSLGALSIEIQVARALLADHQDTAGALDRLAGAQRMAADGLADTRRAVYDVRGDTAPLPQELADMTGTHEERHGTPAMLAVCGQRQPLSPDLTLSLVRVAQECLTNAAKHAPGRPLAVELRYEGHQVTLTISNPLDERLGGTPEKRRHHGVGHTESTVDSVAFATVDGGYGLLGMRERLLLLGGGLTAGVEAGRWVVRAQAPL